VYRKKPSMNWGWFLIIIIATCVGAEQSGAAGAFIGFFGAGLLYAMLSGD
jgi:hypothetical protein